MPSAATTARDRRRVTDHDRRSGIASSTPPSSASSRRRPAAADARGARGRHAARPRVPRCSIGPHRRLALRNLEAAFPAALRGGARGDRARHVRALRPAADGAAEVQHDDARSRCWRASSSRARSGSCAAHAHGRGVLLFTGHFGFWEINALVHALDAHADGGAGAAARQPAAARPARVGARGRPATR